MIVMRFLIKRLNFFLINTKIETNIVVYMHFFQVSLRH